mmetsp:Transcript_17442/g.29925  ORF Transcript_17442/g.29925 Transcript_17442/m.29925 type:complete len:244 (-) Transcript_17442:1184-1915(-)
MHSLAQRDILSASVVSHIRCQARTPSDLLLCTLHHKRQPKTLFRLFFLGLALALFCCCGLFCGGGLFCRDACCGCLLFSLHHCRLQICLGLVQLVVQTVFGGPARAECGSLPPHLSHLLEPHGQQHAQMTPWHLCLHLLGSSAAQSFVAAPSRLPCCGISVLCCVILVQLRKQAALKVGVHTLPVLECFNRLAKNKQNSLEHVKGALRHHTHAAQHGHAAFAHQGHHVFDSQQHLLRHLQGIS